MTRCIDGFRRRTQDCQLNFDWASGLGWKEDPKLPIMAKKSWDALMNILPKALRPQNRDMEAVVLWSVASVVGTFWLIQPWDWLSEQIFGPEEKKWARGSLQQILQEIWRVCKSMQRQALAMSENKVFGGSDIVVPKLRLPFRVNAMSDRVEVHMVLVWGIIALSKLLQLSFKYSM